MSIRTKALKETFLIFFSVVGIAMFLFGMILLGPIGLGILFVLLLAWLFWGTYQLSYREHELYEMMENKVIFHKGEK